MNLNFLELGTFKKPKKIISSDYLKILPLDFLYINHKILPNLPHILGSYIIASSKIKKIKPIKYTIRLFFLLYFSLFYNRDCLIILIIKALFTFQKIY